MRGPASLAMRYDAASTAFARSSLTRIAPALELRFRVASSMRGLNWSSAALANPL
jgi:hypothetical protein